MPSWVPDAEVVIHDKPEYFFSSEVFRRGEDQMVFVHVTVRQWKPSVFKELLRNWKLFRDPMTCPVYAVAGVEDVDVAKWEAFASLFGFKPSIDIVTENGQHRRLFIHFNKAPNNEHVIRYFKYADHTGHEGAK
jgi:hypothetical protein